MKLRLQLPPFYAHLLPSPLLEAMPVESKATCDNCTMAKPQHNKYKAHLKCCTYQPFLPNYLVGGILQSESTAPSARLALEKQMQSFAFTLPIGIVPNPGHQVRFNHRVDGEFGQREDWLCPYYNRSEQNCGVWRFRGAVCTTFYCLSSYGEKGLEFWQLLSDYLTYVEMAMLEESLVEFGFSPRQISDNLAYLNRFEASPEEQKLLVLTPELIRQLWNGYQDNIGEFYRKAYQFVGQWDKRQFKQAMGEQGQILEKDLLKFWRSLNKTS